MWDVINWGSRFEKTDVKETRCECKYVVESQPIQ